MRRLSHTPPFRDSELMARHLGGSTPLLSTWSNSDLKTRGSRCACEQSKLHHALREEAGGRACSNRVLVCSPAVISLQCLTCVSFSIRSLKKPYTLLPSHGLAVNLRYITRFLPPGSYYLLVSALSTLRRKGGCQAPTPWRRLLCTSAKTFSFFHVSIEYALPISRLILEVLAKFTLEGSSKRGISCITSMCLPQRGSTAVI